MYVFCERAMKSLWITIGLQLPTKQKTTGRFVFGILYWKIFFNFGLQI